MLEELRDRSSYAGEWISVHEIDTSFDSWPNTNEARFLMQISEKTSLVELDYSHGKIRLGPAGWAQLEQLGAASAAVAFVAMWFDPQTSDVFENGHPAFYRGRLRLYEGDSRR